MPSSLRLVRTNAPGVVDPAARNAVLVAGLSGLVAVGLAGVAPGWACAIAAAALVLVGRQPERRGLGPTAVLGAAVLACLSQVLQPIQDQELRGVLGLMLMVLQLVHAWSWRSRRDLNMGLVIAGILLVLSASYAPDLVVGVPLLVGWAAVVAAVCLLVRSRLTEGVDVVVPGSGGQGGRGLIAGTVAITMALGLVAFLLIPKPSGAGVHTRLGGSAGSDPTTSTASTSPRATALSSPELDLTARGSLSDQVQIAQVPSDSPRLWRLRTYDDYDGRSWHATPGGAPLPGGPSYVVGNAEGRPTETYRVDVQARNGELWSPSPQVVGVNVEGTLFVGADGYLASAPRTADYEVTAVVSTPDSSALDRGGAPADVDADYRQLPAELPNRVRDLARQITGGATTQRAQVTAVETWLGENQSYRLDSRVPDADEDNVDAFLFVDKEGFCEQFAAAEVVLLRAVGVPARMVVGLAYGTDLGGGVRQFRQSDQHAWVEVPYAGVGWVASDPTAGAAQINATQPSLRQQAAKQLRDLLGQADGFPGGRVALGLTLAALVALSVLLQRWWSRRPGRAGKDVADAAGPDPELVDGPGALAAFARLDRRLGSRRRVPSESLGELRRRLPEVSDALAVVETELYAAHLPSPAVTSRAVADLDGFEPVPHYPL